MLAQILNAALDTAESLDGTDDAVQAEWSEHPPGRRPHRQHGAVSFFRRKRKPDAVEPAAVPGAKPIVAKLFELLPSLTIVGGRIDLTLGGVHVELKPGPVTVLPLVKLLFPGAVATAETIDKALRGESIPIGPGRSLHLVAGNTLPTLIPQTTGSVTFRFARGTEVQQGKFIAALKSIDIFPDRGVVDVEWKLLGLVDLARNPVIWWGD